MKDFRIKIYEIIKNSNEWKLEDVREVFGGFSEQDVDVSYLYKKGNDELELTLNVYDESGVTFKYNNNYLKDYQLLELLNENELIELINKNISNDISWKQESYFETPNVLNVENKDKNIKYKKDDILIEITSSSSPDQLSLITINNKTASKDEMMEFICKLLNIKQENVLVSKKIDILKQFKNSLLGQKNTKKR